MRWIFWLLILIAGPFVWAADAPTGRGPNIVIILCDDLGYNDLSCYHSPSIQTPRIDGLAAEGLRFSSFYVAAPVCTPSRAGLLTGCYPMRISMAMIPSEPNLQPPKPHDVMFPKSVYGLNPDEVTIAKVLKSKGYATQIVGKWHLGDSVEFSPLKQGFDHWLGVPYSNDMKPAVLIRDDKVIADPYEQDKLIDLYTQEAVNFIKARKSEPFFLYLANNAPHVPLYPPARFKGKSVRGTYGDVVMAIDWSVGQVLDTLKAEGLEDNTLVILTSDNGPWLWKGEDGGSATPLRSGKATGYEGGMRVPCIMRWPGHITARRSTDEVASTIDLLPTIAHLTGATLDPTRKIDGLDILPLLTDPAAKSPHEYFLYYYRDRLMAVRSGKWKLKVETTLFEDYGYGYLKVPDAPIPMALYNLDWDPGEQKNVAKDHMDIVKKMQGYLEEARKDLGDARTDIKGSGVRPIGKVEKFQPRPGVEPLDKSADAADPHYTPED
jgi:arylsulfatase A